MSYLSMRRPTRTRRLSIAAIVSMLLLVVVAQAESHWIETPSPIGDSGSLKLSDGTMEFRLGWNQKASIKPGSLSLSEHKMLGFTVTKWVAGFGPVILIIEVPRWPIFLLLLIIPVRWLMGHRANAPAFPVITDSKRNA